MKLVICEIKEHNFIHTNKLIIILVNNNKDDKLFMSLISQWQPTSNSHRPIKITNGLCSILFVQWKIPFFYYALRSVQSNPQCVCVLTLFLFILFMLRMVYLKKYLNHDNIIFQYVYYYILIPKIIEYVSKIRNCIQITYVIYRTSLFKNYSMRVYFYDI